MFHDRHITQKLVSAFAQAKVVLLVGARQVGKSTLLRHIFPNIKSVVFDPVHDEYNIKKQPDLFLKSFKAPMIFDEVQYYPELLASLKRLVDMSDATSQYLLTGSQNFSMLKSVSESMAGRVAILNLHPMTFLERYNKKEFLWVEAYLKKQNLVQNLKPLQMPDSIHRLMWRGGMPGLIGKTDDFVEVYFSSYVQTYIERDVRALADIKNISDFSRFIRLLAMQATCEINAAHSGRELGIANSTAIHWKSTLVQSLLWHEIDSYHGNTIKRLSKKPKGYMMDSGLLCFLNMIHSEDSLAKHPKIGSIFENFVITTIKAYLSSRFPAVQMYHWRTTHGQEVDLILEYGEWIYPIEIKFKTKVDSYDTKGIEAFMATYPHLKIHHGIIIYAGDVCRYVTDGVIAVPWNSVC